jgi:hypothetical protein
MEKTLIYEDHVTANAQTETRNKLNDATLELKQVYDSLALGEPFSRDIFLGLILNGIDSLVPLAEKAFTAQFATTGTDSLLRQFAPVLDYKIVLAPLTPTILKIRQLIKAGHISEYDQRFEGEMPVFTSSDREMISERNRYYVQGEEKKLFQMLNTLCDNINQLESYLKKQKHPGLFSNTLFELSELYFDWKETPGPKEDYIMDVNENVFRQLSMRNKKR